MRAACRRARSRRAARRTAACSAAKCASSLAAPASGPSARCRAPPSRWCAGRRPRRDGRDQRPRPGRADRIDRECDAAVLRRIRPRLIARRSSACRCADRRRERAVFQPDLGERAAVEAERVEPSIQASTAASGSAATSTGGSSASAGSRIAAATATEFVIEAAAARPRRRSAENDLALRRRCATPFRRRSG